MKWLVFLEGGPYDGMVFDSRTLLGQPEPFNLIDDYEWTSRRVTSDRTGQSAQIWQYRNSPSVTIEETEPQSKD